MRAKLLLVASAFLAGCETLGIQPQASPDAAGRTETAALTEPAIPGCSVSMTPRWSVAAVGLPSFIVNFSTQQNETRNVPVVVEKTTPNQTTFNYKDPAGSVNMVTFNVAVTKLKSGVCGMSGTYQMTATNVQRPVTMVPLPAPRPIQ